MDCFGCRIGDRTAGNIPESRRSWCVTDNAKKPRHEFLVGSYASGLVEEATKCSSILGMVGIADYEGASTEVRPEHPSSIVDQALDEVVSEYGLPQLFRGGQE